MPTPPFVLAQLMIGAVILTAALVHLTLAAHRIRPTLNLTFSLLGIFVAGDAFTRPRGDPGTGQQYSIVHGKTLSLAIRVFSEADQPGSATSEMVVSVERRYRFSEFERSRDRETDNSGGC